MAVSSAQFTIDDDPIVALNTAVARGQRLIVKNSDNNNTVYLGAATVAAGDGYLLEKGESVTVQLQPEEILYAVSVAGSALVSVLRS